MKKERKNSIGKWLLGVVAILVVGVLVLNGVLRDKKPLSQQIESVDMVIPYLGIKYQMLNRRTALLNNVPQGAYIVEVVSESPADKGGIKENDIITKIDGEKLTEKNGGLAKVISKKKVGSEIELEIYRKGEKEKIKVELVEE